MNKASIIIPCHNALAEATGPCLESLFAAPPRIDIEVVVVDNGSSDGTREYLASLAKREPRIRCVLNPSNRGFAGGINDGMRAATGESLIILNNDTIPSEGWLDGLVAALRADPAVGLVGPVTNASGNEQRIFTKGRTPGEILGEGRIWTSMSRGEAFDTDRLGFFCVAMRRDVAEKLGPLDEGYGRGYFEDDDFCIRARRAGYRLMCLEDVFVYHRGSASFGRFPSEAKALMRRNRGRLEGKFGAACRFRHPRDRQLDLAESYLERIGTGADASRAACRIRNRVAAAAEAAPKGFFKRRAFERRIRRIREDLAALSPRGAADGGGPPPPAAGHSPGGLRIAVVIPKYGLIGGAEKFAFELTERLARRDRYEIHVFADKWVSASPRIVFHKVPIVRFPRFLRPLSFAWLAARRISGGRFDIVHSHDRIFAADVFTIHSIPHLDWIRSIRRKAPSLFDLSVGWTEERLVRSPGCKRFLPVSTIAGEAYRNKYAIDPAGIRVIHPGVDIEKFSGTDREAARKEVRAEYGIGPSDRVALFVGMNFEVKGLDVLMAAAARAGALHPDKGIRLLVVGKGDFRRYRGIARGLGIADSVVFTGPVSEGVERFYLASDFFAMLSRFDTFGMAALEAMAARLPVIISANVGAKDIVVEGANGFVVDGSLDAGEVAGRIGLLLDDGLRKRMGEEAFGTAANHTWDRMAESVAGIYEEVAAARRGTAEGPA